MRLCSAELDGTKCQRKHDSNGYCTMHRLQAGRNGHVTNIMPRQAKPKEVKPVKARNTKCGAELDGEKCQRKHFANGYCGMHGSQIKRHGKISNLLPTPSRANVGLPAIERFALRIQAGGEDMNCWIWVGSLRDDGYGRFADKTKTHRAHRWLYEQLVRTLSDTEQLDHICTNPPCVRPSHLQPITGATHAKVTKQQRDMLKANEEQVMVGGNPKARSMKEITFALRHGLPGYFHGANMLER